VEQQNTWKCTTPIIQDLFIYKHFVRIAIIVYECQKSNESSQTYKENPPNEALC
jgi:hypothetical protein